MVVVVTFFFYAESCIDEEEGDVVVAFFLYVGSCRNEKEGDGSCVFVHLKKKVTLSSPSFSSLSDLVEMKKKATKVVIPFFSARSCKNEKGDESCHRLLLLFYWVL